MTLDELAIKHDTEKSSLKHDYCHIYESLFPKPEKVQRVLEIGVYLGASLRMWADYFNNASIVGIDPVPQFKGDIPSGVYPITGDATNPKDLGYIETFGPFDLIVDDGSHFWDQIIIAFEGLFLKALAPGGIYVVEDMHVCYRPQHFQHGCPQNPMDYFRSLVDKVNWGGLSEWNRIYNPDGVDIEQLTPMEKWLEAIEFRKGLVIVRKAKR